MQKSRKAKEKVKILKTESEEDRSWDVLSLPMINIYLQLFKLLFVLQITANIGIFQFCS